MSRTQMFYVKESGSVIFYKEYQNSFRGAFLVWNNLFETFCADYIKEKNAKQGWEQKCPQHDEDFQEIWKLMKRDDVPNSYKIVLGSTFDWTILEKDRFSDYLEAVKEYAMFYPVGTLLKQAEDIIKLGRRKILGVCWNQTSVCSMWWGTGRRYLNIKDRNVHYLFRDIVEGTA